MPSPLHLLPFMSGGLEIRLRKEIQGQLINLLHVVIWSGEGPEESDGMTGMSGLDVGRDGEDSAICQRTGGWQ